MHIFCLDIQQICQQNTKKLIIFSNYFVFFVTKYIDRMAERNRNFVNPELIQTMTSSSDECLRNIFQLPLNSIGKVGYTLGYLKFAVKFSFCECATKQSEKWYQELPDKISDIQDEILPSNWGFSSGNPVFLLKLPITTLNKKCNKFFLIQEGSYFFRI